MIPIVFSFYNIIIGKDISAHLLRVIYHIPEYLLIITDIICTKTLRIKITILFFYSDYDDTTLCVCKGRVSLFYPFYRKPSLPMFKFYMLCLLVGHKGVKIIM